MAKKKKTKASKKKAKTAKKKSQRKVAETKPKFPYTNTPGALRKFLSLVPQKPKPAKINQDHLKSWGIGDTNATSIIRVLKALDLVTPSNIPSDKYIDFMRRETGPTVLGEEIRKVYKVFFEASHRPDQDSDADLMNVFHIHSGGGERSMELQLQTFKALCDHATFDGAESSNSINQETAPQSSRRENLSGATTNATASGPTIHIDLHIHLPENKSTREYQAIIEDIGRYIYGQTESIDDR